MGELLAPVGNSEMLQAAIEAGADAVFMAGPNYGARAKEANFTIEELKTSIDVAHLYGLKVYITLNTLIKESEWSACEHYIDNLVALGIDALIVQDLGVVSYCRAHYPNLPLHASTQMAISDAAGLNIAKSLGLSRVVVARETSLDKVKAWESKGMPMEVFVHGALCYAYSGQCLLSGIIGGRSGNRGQCAQPCRLPYFLEGDTRAIYAMSMKDLSTLDHIQHLAQAGITSFKIEGRLRSPDYVYHTVRAYRAALDGVTGMALQSFKERMYQAFNREYTQGHLLGDSDRLNLNMSTNKGELVGKTLKSSQYRLNLQLSAPIYKGDGLKITFGDQSKGIEVFNIYSADGVKTQGTGGETIAIDFNGQVPIGSMVYRTRSQQLTDNRNEALGTKKISLVGHFEAKLNQPLSLVITDGENEVRVTSSESISEAKNAAATLEQVKQSLDKLGDSIYTWDTLNIDLQDQLFLPKAVVNALRREGVEALNDLRLKRHTPIYPKVKSDSKTVVEALPKMEVRTQWHLSVQSNEQIEGALDGALEAGFAVEDLRIFMEGHVYSKAMESTSFSQLQKNQFSPDYKAFSAISKKTLTEDLKTPAECPIGIAHFNQIESNENAPKVLGINSTVMNKKALMSWARLGVHDVLASVELAPRELSGLVEAGARVMVYGQLPVMYTRTCPKKAKGIKCSSCSKSFQLEGKDGQALLVLCDGDLLVYYTKLPIYREGSWPYKLALFVSESKGQTKNIVKALLSKSLVDVPTLEAYQRPVI